MLILKHQDDVYSKGEVCNGCNFVCFSSRNDKDNFKFNGGDFLAGVHQSVGMLIVIITMVGVFQESAHSL